VTGNWKKIHNKELHNLYRMIKSKNHEMGVVQLARTFLALLYSQKPIRETR
jgi:hypothetical protein